MENAKDIIINHLRDNYGREIPISELSEEFGLKASTISNAIRELNLLGEIEIERRQLSRGKYTIIRLKGDESTIPFLHKKENLDLRILNYFKKNEGQKKTIKDIQSYFSYYIEEEYINSESIKRIIINLADQKKLERSGKKSKSPAYNEHFWYNERKDEKNQRFEFENVDVPFDNLIKYLLSPDYDSLQFIDTIKKLSSRFLNPLDLIWNIITPLMYEVGKRWEQGDISISQEHIISNRIEKLIIAAINLQDTNGKQGIIIMLPVEGEKHIMSLLSLELIFTSLNFKVINIGKELPIGSLINYIKLLPNLPDWVFFTITLNSLRSTLVQNIETIKNLFGNKIMIAIGGQGLGLNDKYDPNYSKADHIIITNQDFRDFLKKLN